MSTFDRTKAYYSEPNSPNKMKELFSNYRELTRWSFIKQPTMSSYNIQYKTMCELLLHQVDSATILEMGPGRGFTANVMKFAGFKYYTLDVQEDNKPDILCDVKDFEEEKYKGKFDMISTFQTLEHIPYDDALNVIERIAYASNNYVFISVPHYCKKIQLKLTIPFLGKKSSIKLINKIKTKLSHGLQYTKVFSIKDAPERKYREEFKKEFPYAIHYWELGRNKRTIKTFINDIETMGLRVVKNFPNPDYPYHHYFLIEVK